MKVFRHEDALVEQTIWTALALAESDSSEWSITATSFAGIVRNVSKDVPSAKEVIETQKYVLVNTLQKGSPITISRDDGSIYDNVQFLSSRPVRPEQPAGPNKRRYGEELAAYNESLAKFEAAAPVLDRVHSRILAGLGQPPDSEDPRHQFIDLVYRRDAQLSRFEIHIEKIVQDLRARQLEIEKERSERIEELLRDSKEKLEEERTKLEAEFEIKKSELQSAAVTRQSELERREAEVAIREKAADDSDNRAARRRLRKDILDILNRRSDNFSLTQGTQTKRKPVIWTAISAMVVFGGLLVALTLGSSKYGSSASWLIVPQISAALGFAGATIFLLQFTQQWAKRHADEEFYLKRLELDLERANWLVEMSLEYAHERSEGIPPEMFERLSRGLFNVENSAEVRHPLQALLGSASEANVHFPNMDVNLKRGGLQKLSKEPASGSGEPP